MAKAPKKAAATLPEPRPARPKAEAVAERYPNLEKNPALRRALVIMRALASGKSRQEADELAEAKVGPRSPKSKPMKRGKRPEPPKRQRVKATATLAMKR